MMKCTHCDKPLTEDEVKETTNECFDCEIKRHIKRLMHHVANNRVFMTVLINDLLNAPIQEFKPDRTK